MDKQKRKPKRPRSPANRAARRGRRLRLHVRSRAKEAGLGGHQNAASPPPASSVDVWPSAGARFAERYELLQEIGSGGMGRVFQARDLALGRDVAIKVLAGSHAEDEDFRRQLEREARAAARLVHPGIAITYDLDRQHGESFLVMEFVPGQTLRQHLLARGTLAPDQAVTIVGKLAEALEYAHRQGVLHCDIKPQNVILTPAGEPKLVDFGIARAATATRSTERGVLAGTISYVAPEVLGGDDPDARSDLYSLGVVLYELLTGRPPFQAPSLAAALSQQLEAEPPRPRSLNPNVTPDLEQVAQQATARERSHRYQDAAAFRAALAAVETSAASHTRREAASLPSPLAGTSLDILADARQPVRATLEPDAAAPRYLAWRAQRFFKSWRSDVRVPTVVLGGVLALGIVFTILLGGDDLPGSRWGTFVGSACQWSNSTTPPAICFGERGQGYRVRVVGEEAERWMVWDPETQNVAYVDKAALKVED